MERAFRCFNEGDWEAMAELYTPDVVGVGPEGWPETRAEGREALIDQFRRLAGEGVESRAVVEEAVEHDGAVVARMRWRVTGATSGLSEETAMSGSFRVANGRITAVRFFWDHDEAVADAAARE